MDQKEIEFHRNAEKKKKRKRKEAKIPLLDRTSLDNNMAKKIALIRIKNDLFLSRKPPVFIVQ